MYGEDGAAMADTAQAMKGCKKWSLFSVVASFQKVVHCHESCELTTCTQSPRYKIYGDGLTYPKPTGGLSGIEERSLQ